MIFNAAVDFTGLPVENFVLQKVVSNPSTGLYEGRMVWNTTQKAAYVYGDGTWSAFGIAGTVPQHTHAISDVTNLQSTLDGKASVVHLHAISDVTNLQSTLDGKAPTSHTHNTSQITDFNTSVNGLINSYITSGAVNTDLDTIIEITTQIKNNKDALAALQASSLKYSADFGNGTATSFDINHGLNTLDVIVELYRKSDGVTFYANVSRVGVNVVRISGFGTPPTANQYRVVIRG